MKILIVEDDPNKLGRVRECIEAEVSAATISERRSYQSGLKAILESPPDVIVLDMAMPTYDVTPAEKGGRPRPFGGRDILAQMKRRKVEVDVIVLTQYETFGEGAEQRSLQQLHSQLRREFPNNYLGVVFYHPAETDWRKQLLGFLAGTRMGASQ